MFKFYFVPFVREGEHAEFASVPVSSRTDDVREKESEATVIVEPPNVDCPATFLFLLEQEHLADDFFW